MKNFFEMSEEERLRFFKSLSPEALAAVTRRLEAANLEFDLRSYLFKWQRARLAVASRKESPNAR